MAIYGDRIANEVFRLPALRLKAYGRNVLRQRVAEKNDQEHRQRSDQQSSLEILHAYIPPISGIPVAFIPTKKQPQTIWPKALVAAWIDRVRSLRRALLCVP